MKLIYHPAAEAELIAAALFYEEKIKGLGFEFLDEFERCMVQILEARVGELFVATNAGS